MYVPVCYPYGTRMYPCGVLVKIFYLRLRANGHNIVDQQLPTLLDVTCCVGLHTLLRVVAQSLKPVKRLAPCKRTQHCWPTTPNIVGSYCARLHVALHYTLNVRSRGKLLVLFSREHIFFLH